MLVRNGVMKCLCQQLVRTQLAVGGLLLVSSSSWYWAQLALRGPADLPHN